MRDCTDDSRHAKMHVETASRKVDSHMEPILVGDDPTSLTSERWAARRNTEIDDFLDATIGRDLTVKSGTSNTL